MTAQPNNRFVFCVVVVKFAVSGNQALQNVDFWKVGNMQFLFQELFSHIDKNSGGKVWGYVPRQNSK